MESKINQLGLTKHRICLFYHHSILTNEFERTKRLAEGGDKAAQNNLLGAMYDFGLGVPEDDKEAVKWYTKSAEQGDAEAQFNLGYMYYKGEGVPKDYKEAVKWFTKSAEQGDAQAQYNLGLMYNNSEKECPKTTRKRSSGTPSRPSRGLQMLKEW